MTAEDSKKHLVGILVLLLAFGFWLTSHSKHETAEQQPLKQKLGPTLQVSYDLNARKKGSGLSMPGP
jgi:hypothetical protein